MTERLTVSLEISLAKDAVIEPHMVMKSLFFKCLPDDAEKLFRMACEAIEREKEDGESGSTSEKGGREQAKDPPALGEEGPPRGAYPLRRRKPRSS